MKAIRNAHPIVGGKPEGNTPLARPRYGWEHISIDLKEINVRMWAGFSWLGVWYSGGRF
jgi:hypothetical protein